MVTLLGTVHPLTRQAGDLGEADPGMQLESLTLSIAPSVRQGRRNWTLSWRRSRIRSRLSIITG